MSGNPDIRQALAFAAEELSNAGVPEPQRDARGLVCLAAGVDTAFTFAHPERVLTDMETERLQVLVARRAAHEPFQYISGRQEFYGREFLVTPAVMIPRPETELIVEEGVRLLTGLPSPRICEVGVGSGCITVSFLCEMPEAEAVALDISPAAIDVASENASRLGVSDRVTFRESDVFSALSPGEEFDLVVSNPPYVPARDVETLQAEVRDYEPKVALTEGGSGLSIIERIVNEAGSRLKDGGYLLMEIGFNQSAAVTDLFTAVPEAEAMFFPDLQGIPRMVKARYSTT